MIVLRRRGDEDIEGAIAFYLSESGPVIAADFIDRLEEILSKISRNPAAGSPPLWTRTSYYRAAALADEKASISDILSGKRHPYRVGTGLTRQFRYSVLG